MTKFNYSEVQGVFTSSQSDRVACLSNFSTVETNLADFTATSVLTGPGWDSAKQALSPYSVVTKALYNYHCDFGETYTVFLANFEGEVGETGKTLDTEELRELQNKLNRIQQEKQDLLIKIAGNIALEIIGGYGVMVKDFQLGETQKKIDLLEKYETFENGHTGDFSEIVSTGGDLTSALSDLGKSKSFNAATGTYTYSDLKTKNWYTNLKDYNDSCPSQRVEIVKADEYGYVLKVYINGHYSEVASTNLMYAQSKEGLKELGITMKDMAGEMTGLYSLYRLFNGKDPVTGEQASRLEAGLWVALLLLPQAKMVSAARELRAGNRLLTGANLTAKDLQILNKAGYFDDVGKINRFEQASRAGKLKVPQGLTDKQFVEMSDLLKSRLGQIGDDIFVQGSRAGGTAKATSDIDIGVRVTKKQFDELIKKSFGTPNPGSARERTMLHAIETGKIQAGEAKLRGLRKELENLLGIEADVSIILEGGKFDNPPYLPIK